MGLRRAALAALAALTLALPGGVLAAGPPTPDRTTASYGDWVLRCETVEAGTPGARRVCEVAQTMQLRLQQGQPALAAEIAIGRAAKSEPMKVTFAFVPNIYIPSAPRVVFADTPKLAVDLVWQRCLPLRCFGDATLGDSLLKQLRDRTEPGRIEFKDAVQHDVNVALSFRGLPEALDALAAAGP